MDKQPNRARSHRVQVNYHATNAPCPLDIGFKIGAHRGGDGIMNIAVNAEKVRKGHFPFQCGRLDNPKILPHNT